LSSKAASYAVANFDVLDAFTKSDNLTGNIAPTRPWEGHLWTIMSGRKRLLQELFAHDRAIINLLCVDRILSSGAVLD
jgi:hypothetical protein